MLNGKRLHLRWMYVAQKPLCLKFSDILGSCPPTPPFPYLVNSEFTQQDGRKTTTADPLCVTNVTRPLLVLFVFTNINVFWSFTKRSV